jgi:uncharacterized protein (TIGR03435 family)
MMRNLIWKRRNRYERFSLTKVRVVMLVVLAAVAATAVQNVRAQSVTPQSSTPAASGDGPAFNVASVKLNKSGDVRTQSNIPFYSLDSGNAPTTGFLSATNEPLLGIIGFAYKLTAGQQRRLVFGLPNQINSERFDIQARADSTPGRDQIRLMVQSLLADRFKLAMHHETRQIPVYKLVLSKSGKTGPQLVPYSSDHKCLDYVSGDPPPPRGPDGLLTVPLCGELQGLNTDKPGQIRMMGGRLTMQMFAGILSAFPGIDRTVVDQTGLSGAFNVSFDIAIPGRSSAAPNPDGVASDPSLAPSIFTVLQEQLGLKLDPQTAAVDVLVVDHVEEPTPN